MFRHDAINNFPGAYAITTHVGPDLQCSHAVEAVQLLESRFYGVGSNRIKGNFGARRGPDIHAIEVGQGPPLLFRIAHHDLDVLPAAGNSLGFSTIEGLADLGRHTRQADPQRLGRRLQVQDHLIPGRIKGVADVEHPRVGKQSGPGPGRHGFQVIGIAGSEDQFDRFARIPDGEVHPDFLGLGHWTDKIPVLIGKLLRVQILRNSANGDGDFVLVGLSSDIADGRNNRVFRATVPITL